jgi:DNA-binding response OmpR family regulator
MEHSSVLYIDYKNEMSAYYQSLLEKSIKHVHVVDNRKDAYLYYKENNPDIVIIELTIPKALSFVKTIREKDRDTIFLALTEDTSVSTLRSIVELSFSAYMIKPVEEEEIQSTLLKISNNLKYKKSVDLPLGCQWNIKSKVLFCQGSRIFLTPRESKLFELLVQKRDTFCSEDEIYCNVWSDEIDKTINTASIRTLVKNLRKKVPNGLILNRYGIGYKIIA